MFYGFVITEAGNSLLASMVAGQTLTITKAVMGEGTADNAEAARQLTNLITPGPEATSTTPTVDGNSVNMIVEYRSDLNGGLQEGFWIGEFGIFGKVGDGAEAMIGYGSLGDAKQYVSAYVSGTAPDVRRYPVSITVTTGIQVDVDYPAEAWMTADDVAEYIDNTVKPELKAELTSGGKHIFADIEVVFSDDTKRGKLPLIYYDGALYIGNDASYITRSSDGTFQKFTITLPEDAGVQFKASSTSTEALDVGIIRRSSTWMTTYWATIPLSDRRAGLEREYAPSSSYVGMGITIIAGCLGEAEEVSTG